MIITNKIPTEKYLVTATPKELETEKERILDERENLFSDFKKGCDH